MPLILSASFSFSADTKPPEQNFKITVEKALREFRQNEVLIIDVRSQKSYEKLYIPGSLNIPLFAIKTKPFLKNRPIILVNEGFGITPLETECRALREKGFNAEALMGGIIAWDAQKAPLEGDPRFLAEFRLVSANLFQQEKNRAGLILVDASIPEPTKPIKPTQLIQPIKPVQLKTFISNNNQQKQSLQTVLIYNQDGAGYENIHYELEKAGIGPVFYLSGGMKGYNTFLNNLALLHRPREERTESIRACPSCAKKQKDDV